MGRDNIFQSVTFSFLKINIYTVEYGGELCTTSPLNFACLMKTLAASVVQV